MAEGNASADLDADLEAEALPIPFGIEAATGFPLPGVTEADLARIAPDPQEVLDKKEKLDDVTTEAVVPEVDPNNLREAGWCVVFAEGADPAIREALAPLLELRKKQTGGEEPLYTEFTDGDGVRPGEDARKWVERHGAGLATVDPLLGVPLYVLLVGSPEEIPFEFQYMLDLYWNVGRVHFGGPADYGRYAENVVAYESAAEVKQRKEAVFFSVQNPGDSATAQLLRDVTRPLLTADAATGRTLQGWQGFRVDGILAQEATKARLLRLLSGGEDGGVPALLFTGSHGVRFEMTDPLHREKQGAILCQDWPGFGPTDPEHVFTAADLPEDAKLGGLIHFLFACYGGGCPKMDDFGRAEGEEPQQLLANPIVARLPQKMLLSGALATVAHIDRAWAFSFQNLRRKPLAQDFRQVMMGIMRGDRVGQALDGFNMRWAVLAADLSEAQEKLAGDPRFRTSLANRYVARNDARNYVVLGDPAVRLRTEDMAPSPAVAGPIPAAAGG